MNSVHTPVTTVILAGGLGRRMGGDKGLQALHGRVLLSWVLEAVRQNSNEILINANSNRQDYAQFGFRVIADQLPDWPGPLAGLHAALLVAQNEYVMTVPCDTPFLPDDLIPRLFGVLTLQSTEAAVAVTGGRRQPTIALYRKNVLSSLLGYLASGERKVNDWLDSLQLSEVVFDNVGSFDNINTLDDLSLASERFNSTGKE
ncbi:MAG: molybdenum cofactor guanylyltransferase MobA [Gallionellaceae bacterium]|jgi:molybdopterin-guanine dinucleotide biosynthesis protein A